MLILESVRSALLFLVFRLCFRARVVFTHIAHIYTFPIDTLLTEFAKQMLKSCLWAARQRISAKREEFPTCFLLFCRLFRRSPRHVYVVWVFVKRRTGGPTHEQRPPPECFQSHNGQFHNILRVTTDSAGRSRCRKRRWLQRGDLCPGSLWRRPTPSERWAPGRVGASVPGAFLLTPSISRANKSRDPSWPAPPLR